MALVAVLVALAVGVAIAVTGGDGGGGTSLPERVTAPVQSGDVGAAPVPEGPPEVETVRRVRVGAGAQAAVALVPEPREDPAPAVVFLHGWGLTRVNDYGPWLRHLARDGNVVIFPRYQLDDQSDPALARGDAIAGVRAALDEVPVDEESLVVAGHSAGAALAVDLAAVSASEGLPAPAGVFAVYPGRTILGYPAGIPAADYGGVAADTEIVVMAGASDEVDGQTTALAIYNDLTQGSSARPRYLLVQDPQAYDHFAPTRATPSVRTTFWRRLDRLLERART